MRSRHHSAANRGALRAARPHVQEAASGAGGDLDALPPDAPRVLLATGKLVGEGFDHPPLDTLVLAMPVSWKGTLQQYAGRLHREHASKTDVRIIDFVDTGHPALLRMWDKRQRGYRAMGYRLGSNGSMRCPGYRLRHGGRPACVGMLSNDLPPWSPGATDRHIE
jgi:hypothetical protein